MKQTHNRTGPVLSPSERRMLLLPMTHGNKERRTRLFNQIKNLAPSEIKKIKKELETKLFSHHREAEKIFLENFYKALPQGISGQTFSEDQKLVAGSYYSKEYSVEAAALSNPSIVEHPDRSKLPKGATRFILTLRAIGEGHVSSVEFREGLIGGNGEITVKRPGRFLCLPEYKSECAEFSGDLQLDERILFPHFEYHKSGIEDMRLVKFTEKDKTLYYGTYTAFDGKTVRPGIIKTADFQYFEFIQPSGKAAAGKNWALFPKKINGQYAALSRQDGENISIMFSDTIRSWNNSAVIIRPERYREKLQVGTCGPPLLIEEGWLVIYHAVGPVREYSLGAILLDKKDPSKIIGRLGIPLLEPSRKKRGGYVPNAVYSCGGIIKNGSLFLPYSICDRKTAFARTDIASILKRM
ncbi:MAG: glycosidase [Fibrobacterota bacterium]